MGWIDAVSDAATKGWLSDDQISVIARKAEMQFQNLMLGGELKFGDMTYSLASPGFMGDSIEKSIRQVMVMVERKQNDTLN